MSSLLAGFSLLTANGAITLADAALDEVLVEGQATFVSLAGMNIDPMTVIPLIRALRASVHGFVDLELRGGFGLPNDIDDSFATTIGLVIEAIAAHSSIGVGS